jgi:YVTN family beta-propeller protein
VAVGNRPTGLAVDDKTSRIYVTDSGIGNVSSIDGTTDQLIDNISVGGEPVAAAFDPWNGDLFVADAAGSDVAVVFGYYGDVIATVDVGTDPDALAYDAADMMVYVANGGPTAGTSSVSVINATADAVVTTLAVGVTPDAVVVDPATDFVFVANYASGTVSAINAARGHVATTITVGSGPDALAYDPDNGYVYVANEGSRTLMAINATSFQVAATISGLGAGPLGIAYDPYGGDLYLTGAGRVTVVNASIGKVAGSVAVGSTPEGIAYAASDGRLFVANDGSDNVSILAPIPFALSLDAFPSPTDVNVPVRFGANYSGGLPPYDQFSWTFGDRQSQQTTSAGVDHTYSESGDLTPSVTSIDGAGVQLTATVALTVDPQITAPPPNATRPSGDVGQSVSFTDAVAGGTPPYLNWVWGGFPAGCTGMHSPEVNCTFIETDTLSLTVDITDSVGGNTGPTHALSFQVYAAPLTGAPTANRSSADVGQSVTFVAQVSGGPGWFTSYNWSGLPPTGCTNVTSAHPSCRFALAGSYVLGVSATDGNRASSGLGPGLNFTVYPDPSAGAPVANRTGSDVGQPVNVTERWSGGSGGFVFLWRGLPTDCIPRSGPSFACAFASAGALSITVAVRDSNGGVSAPSAPLAFTVASDPVAGAPVIDPSTITPGEGVTVSAAVTGGAGGGEYGWLGLPNGCSGTGATVRCDPSDLGIYAIQYGYRDANGFVATSPPAELTVAAAATFLGLPAAEGYALTLALVLVAALAVVVLVRRRRRPAAGPALPEVPEAEAAPEVDAGGGPRRPEG